jgi:hypothetical protein
MSSLKRRRSQSYSESVAAIEPLLVLAPAAAAFHGIVEARQQLLETMPTEAVEPGVVLFLHSASLGSVVAVRSFAATDITILQRPQCVLRGAALRFSLALAAAAAPRNVSFNDSLRGLMSVLDLRVEVRLPASTCAAAATAPAATAATVDVTAVGNHQPLAVTFVEESMGDSIAWITVNVPSGATLYSDITATLSERSRSFAATNVLVVARVMRGSLVAPMIFGGFEEASVHAMSPCVSATGSVFVPKYDRNVVHTFNEDGLPLLDITLARLGLSDSCSAAAMSREFDTLLLADDSEIIAVRCSLFDPVAGLHDLLWRTQPRSLRGSCGIAVSPTLDRLFVTSVGDSMLHCHRVSNGSLISSVFLPCGNPRFVAVDPISGDVFVSADGVVCVVRYCVPGFDVYSQPPRGGWPLAEGGLLVVTHAQLEAAGQGSHCRPLCVVPPRASSDITGLSASSAFLVVGEYQMPLLRVIRLPDLALMHTHRLDGVQLVGLASDPGGSALVICDARSGQVGTMPWPLPGMPDDSIPPGSAASSNVAATSTAGANSL